MAVIYAINCDENCGSPTVKRTWESAKETSPIPSDGSDFCVIDAFNKTLLIGTSPGQKQLVIYEISTGAASLTTKETMDVKLAYDAVSSFSVAGMPHILAYEQKTGVFDFFRITSGLSLENIYSYSNAYGPSTTNFTTVKAYDYQGEMLLLCYNTGNGDAKIYQLQVTADEPLTMNCIWSKSWSPGWVRFSFFKMGKENFFIKSNIQHKTVYIDHLNGDATTGSRPVGRRLPLPLDLNIVQTFELAGCIHLMAYRQSGETMLNRLHTDCQGWTEELAFTAIEHAKCAVPFSQGGACFLFLF